MTLAKLALTLSNTRNGPQLTYYYLPHTHIFIFVFFQYYLFIIFCFFVPTTPIYLIFPHAFLENQTNPLHYSYSLHLLTLKKI